MHRVVFFLFAVILIPVESLRGLDLDRIQGKLIAAGYPVTAINCGFEPPVCEVSLEGNASATAQELEPFFEGE